MRIDIAKAAVDFHKFQWQPAITSVSMLPEHLIRRRCGLIITAIERDRMERCMVAALTRTVTAKYPQACDWREWATPIRDQANCGSCVAFGTVAALESQLKLSLGDPDTPVDLSEAYLFFCGAGKKCNLGWQIPPALEFCQEYGVADESCFPYIDQDVACVYCADAQAQAVRAGGWHEIYDGETRREWLASTGPVVAAMAVYDDFPLYAGGIYKRTSSFLLGHHCVACFGYDEARQAWLCKNSWGTGWGESGWFWIGYGECGLDLTYPFWAVEGAIPAGTDPLPPVPEQPGGCLGFLKRLRG